MSEKFVLSLSFTNDCIATQTLPLNTPFFRVGILCYYRVSVALCSQERVCYSTEKSRCLETDRLGGGNNDGWMGGKIWD